MIQKIATSHNAELKGGGTNEFKTQMGTPSILNDWLYLLMEVSMFILEFQDCYSCGLHYQYSDDDVVTGCDTIEGQYVEYEATKCPMCGCENKI